MQETSIPTKKLKVIILGFAITSGSFTMAAPKIIGADSKKEKRAALSRVSPVNRPVVIVIPERDTPGMIAKACDNPIRKLVPKLMFSNPVDFLLF